MDDQARSQFVRSRLPWLLAAAAALLYLLTLNSWISLSSLPVVASLSAHEWTAPLTRPLQALITLPFRWLPPSWLPVALNLFSALCATLTIALLARSVALLPHDRTREQRLRERSDQALLSVPGAWLPPVFAALVCALQMTFWEHATAATGEMFDLLLFAYLVRCLLEYRLSEEDKWLSRLALVYGLAVTNNFALIGYFPAFLGALIWIMGRSFFDLRLIARLIGLGSVGLTLYLFLPILNALDEQSQAGFWDALRLQLAGQKQSLLSFPVRSIAFCAALTSVVPLFVIGIRWPSSFGDTSVIGSVLTNWMFRVVHIFLLAAGIWVALDAPFSARSLLDKRILQHMEDAFGAMSFLTFHYLGSLCLGYFLGYCLLIFGTEGGKSWQKISSATRLMNRLATALVWVAAFAVPALLAYRNLPSIRLTNGGLLRVFAKAIEQSLPQQGGVLVSDFSSLLGLVETHLESGSRAGKFLCLDTRLLPYPTYQKSIHHRFPATWPYPPEAPDRHSRFDSTFLIQELVAVTMSNTVHYLHPSFGYFFEPLYLRPRGLIYQLQFYATNAVMPPPLTEPELELNRRFWKESEPEVARLRPTGPSRSHDARVLGRWYSRALNTWGVDLQRNGLLEEAGRTFELATRLNPGNLAAEINRNYNASLRAGKPVPVEIGRNIEDKFGSRYRSWNEVLAANGPIDEPAFCHRLGQTLAQQSLLRQAAIQFIRAFQLDPSNIDAALWLANVYLQGGAPDKTLELIAQVQKHAASRPLAVTNQIAFIRFEALAHFSSGKLETAERILMNARQQFPKDDAIAETLVQVYLSADRLADARDAVEHQLKRSPEDIPALLNLTLIYMRLQNYDQAARTNDRVLKLDPNNVAALLNQGAIAIQTKAFKDAIAPLDKVLRIQPENRAAQMNRAIANLQSGQLDAARLDYQELLKAFPGLHSIHYGLGEIAYQRKQMTAAVTHYEAYLKSAPTETAEYKLISDRLRELQSAPR